MAFGYRKWREWRCEHCTYFKILTQTIMSAFLMRTLFSVFIFCACGQLSCFLLLSVVQNLFKHDREMNLMKYYARKC